MKLTLYLSAEEMAFVKSYEPGMVRGLIRDLMYSAPRPGDPETIEEAVVVQKQANELLSKQMNHIQNALAYVPEDQGIRTEGVQMSHTEIGGECATSDRPVGARVTAADELRKLADGVALQSANTAQRVLERLEPVMVQAAPLADGDSSPQETWPPLFAGLRESLERVQDSLRSIDACLNRLEL